MLLAPFHIGHVVCILRLILLSLFEISQNYTYCRSDGKPIPQNRSRVENQATRQIAQRDLTLSTLQNPQKFYTI
jgi:hypothetical protein